jgi:cyanophycinase
MQRMLASLQSRREQAADEEVLTRLKAADIVMFTGGDQLRLTSILRNSFHDILLDKYHNEEFIYAGTSAERLQPLIQ